MEYSKKLMAASLKIALSEYTEEAINKSVKHDGTTLRFLFNFNSQSYSLHVKNSSHLTFCFPGFEILFSELI